MMEENAHFVSGAQKIRLYMGSMRMQGTTSKLMMIAKDYVKLIGGLVKCPLDHPE